MDEQDMMNQQAALGMGRMAYMSQDNTGINTLLNDLTNVDPMIHEVELMLQGKTIDEEGNEVQTCEPLCNKEGASNMIRFMKSMTSRVVLMSNFDEQQARVMTIEMGNDMVEDLTFNKVRYEIKHPKAIATIVDLILTNSFSCAMSAMDNGTRKMLKATSMETTINTQGIGMKGGKGNGIGSILGLGKRN